jgi:hypothetical protein
MFTRRKDVAKEGAKGRTAVGCDGLNRIFKIAKLFRMNLLGDLCSRGSNRTLTG